MATAKKTTSTSKTTAKAATPAAPTPPVAEPAPAPAVISAAVPVVAGPMLKKSELIDRVMERCGAKKRDAKPVVEAMLAVLGEAIASGEELNLQPFGKLKINNEKELANGKVLNCRIRQAKKAIVEPPVV
ncbi:HU family DNA-binding protein [Algirhabdus cladophorae]|uniref:HU family DNA-binding protein n=1 Tax=Algirhabdus cladophorae TaxID=3377108 RepID=UPI003B848FA5